MLNQPVENTFSEEYIKKVAYAEAMADLVAKEKEINRKKGYGKAYFWSFFLPPIGLYYFIKYLFFSEGEGESIRAGVISLVLTLVSILISVLFFATILNQASSVVPGADLQMLKDLTTPEKQKEILQLYK